MNNAKAKAFERGWETLICYRNEPKGSEFRWQFVITAPGVNMLSGCGKTAHAAKADCKKRFLEMMAKTHDILAVFDK